MTHALTILIASSVGWATPEARPTRTEIDLIVASVETTVVYDAAPAMDVVISMPSLAAPEPPAMPSVTPVLNDFRAVITYDLALPYFRTKP
jgi:hypothetical protein